MDLQEAFDKERGLRRRLARELKITHGAVSQWRRVPAERVLDVARITGIPKEELRPDLYKVEEGA
jgi:DNA-binding transcriptional regulator YdaS (Cro superfamily)